MTDQIIDLLAQQRGKSKIQMMIILVDVLETEKIALRQQSEVKDYDSAIIPNSRR